MADPNNPGRGGDHIALAIEVGEHPEPVGEMKRIYQLLPKIYPVVQAYFAPIPSYPGGQWTWGPI